jgi:hypothetical protein
MYTGTLIEDLIATVERVESRTAEEPTRFLRQEDMDIPVAYLLDSLYEEQLLAVA